MDALVQLNSALAGRYAIDREVGAGGMATVYLARDVRHERNVALKVLNPEALEGGERTDRLHVSTRRLHALNRDKP